MDFQLERRIKFPPEKGWKAFARAAISEKITDEKFFDASGNVKIQFLASQKEPCFNFKKVEEIETISLGEPKDGRVKDMWDIAEDKVAFLQLAFLHEVGHVLFKKFFGDQTNDFSVLRTVQPKDGRGFLDEFLPATLGAEKKREEFLMIQGARLKEMFSDTVSILAGAALNIPTESLSLLYVGRIAEEKHTQYDTSRAIRMARRHLRENGTPTAISQCASIAEQLALETLKVELQEAGLLEKPETFNPGKISTLSHLEKEMAEKLNKRRLGKMARQARIKPQG